MVSTFAYALTCFIFLTQERVTSPSSSNEQAPQCPVPHPTFVPVSPRRRTTSARESFSGSQRISRSTPLMFKTIL